MGCAVPPSIRVSWRWWERKCCSPCHHSDSWTYREHSDSRGNELAGDGHLV
jgi:hypothetical protein